MSTIKAIRLLSSVSIAVILMLPLPALAAQTQETVGRFLVDIALLKKLDAPDPASAERSLREAGYTLPSLRLDGPLTEDAVVGIGQALGLNLRTHRAGAPFTDTQASDFLSTFRDVLSRGNGDSGKQGAQGKKDDEENPPGPYPRPDGAADPASKGKGKKKGLQSPCEPH